MVRTRRRVVAMALILLLAILSLAALVMVDSARLVWPVFLLALVGVVAFATDSGDST